MQTQQENHPTLECNAQQNTTNSAEQLNVPIQTSFDNNNVSNGGNIEQPVNLFKVYTQNRR